MNKHSSSRLPSTAWVDGAGAGPILISPLAEVRVRVSSALDVDWADPPHRDDAIRTVVKACEQVFNAAPGSFSQSVEPSGPADPDLNVRIVMAAPVTDQSEQLLRQRRHELEQQLQTKLRVVFGWEQAAVSATVEPHPSFPLHPSPVRRPGGAAVNAGGLTVYYPNEVSGPAVAPVIVGVPHSETHYAETQREERSRFTGWFGALCAVGLAIAIALTVGPLLDLIEEKSNEIEVMRVDHDWQLAMRAQEIETLEKENQRLSELASELAQRRPAPVRVNRPPQGLPDTDRLARRQALPDTDQSVAAREAPGQGVALASTTP
ncbi:hypothetical protein [Terricaulis sp.]|uniref:hypothetical protein n=1 Tax=Terricaulis sp. TaxID=2768686 RepID=UPI002AC66CE8|nr:hypothetical protein [Terricaulis sp.]MDZ4689997.1 hypothetical protein [Terricaulis sp.]